MKRLGVLVGALGCVLLHAPVCQAAKPLRVVATLSSFADIAKQIGGERVEVSTIAPPRFNPHFIEPRPSDVLKVKRAELFIHAGLDLEAWRGPLVDAAGNRAAMPGGEREVDLSRGIQLLEVPDRSLSRAEGDIHLYGNPHYWLDPENGKQIAKTIGEKLCAIDPGSCDAYQSNLQQWVRQLDARLSTWRSLLAPYKGQELVGYHNAWPYLMRFAGFSMRYFLEPKPGIPPTPKHVQFLQQYMPQHHIRVVVQSGYAPQSAAQALTKRTGARVVVLCQSVGELPACGDYVSMMNHNVNQLVQALGAPQ